MTMDRSRLADGGRDVWDRVFNALAAEPRRQLICSLLDVSPGVDLPLPDAAMSPTMEADLETLRTNLHHRHLPLLTDRGYVRWDIDPFRARRGPRFEEVACVLEALDGNPDPIPEHLLEASAQLGTVGQMEE